MSEDQLRKRTLELENRRGSKLYCNISSMRCYYCPLCMAGMCPHLKRFLETGSWKEE